MDEKKPQSLFFFDDVKVRMPERFFQFKYDGFREGVIIKPRLMHTVDFHYSFDRLFEYKPFCPHPDHGVLKPCVVKPRTLKAKPKAFVPRLKRWQAPLSDGNLILEGRDSIPKPPKHDVAHALADVWQQFKPKDRDHVVALSGLFTPKAARPERVHPATYWIDPYKDDWTGLTKRQDAILAMRVRRVKRLIETTVVRNFGLPISFVYNGTYFDKASFSVKTEVTYREDDTSTAMPAGKRGPLFFLGTKSIPIHLPDREVLRALRNAAAQLVLHELDECFFDDKGVRVFDPHDRQRWLADEIKPIPA